MYNVINHNGGIAGSFENKEDAIRFAEKKGYPFEEEKENSLVCKVCGKVCKSEFGLSVHNRKCK